MHPIDAKYRHAPDPRAQLAELLGTKRAPVRTTRPKVQGPSGRCDLRVTIPLPPRELSPNSNAQWQAKLRAKKKWQEAIRVVLRITNPAPLLLDEATVEPTFYFRNRNIADKDNAGASLKFAYDVLTEWGLLRDDKGLTPLPVVREVDKSNPRVELRIYTPCNR